MLTYVDTVHTIVSSITQLFPHSQLYGRAAERKALLKTTHMTARLMFASRHVGETGGRIFYDLMKTKVELFGHRIKLYFMNHTLDVRTNNAW